MGRAEREVEGYLIKQVEAMGGFTRKVVYQGRTGSPDRWCFLPGGLLLIVECKAEDEKPKRHQVVEMKKLRESGQRVAWIESRAEVDEILKIEHLRATAFEFNKRWPL